MKRQLSVQHLLYNATRKPNYVRDWFDRLQNESRLHHATEDDNNSMRAYPWRSFVDGDTPIIRELDFRQAAFAPTLFESFCDGLPSIAMLVRVRLAFPVAKSRYLDWHQACLSYDPTNGTYRLSVEDNDDVPGEHRTVRLTTVDRKALDLLIGSAIKHATQGI